MKKLLKSCDGAIAVRPRWPYRAVWISDAAYRGLIEAQNRLEPHGIRIAVTRGFEDEGNIVRALHFLARCVGAVVFSILFVWRVGEIKGIFSANGHDSGGNCLDVEIVRDGHRLVLLPFGVFTTRMRRDETYRRYRETIDMVWSVLRSCGFTIHSNATEAMQIHCEYCVGESGGNEG